MLTIEVRADPDDFRIMRAAGHAHIYLNGALQYKGRPKTGYNCEGEITDLEGCLVTRCSSFAANWWRASLDHRTYVIQSDVGTELARIRRHGFFGNDCEIFIEGQEHSCPQRGEIVLPGAILTVSAQPLEVQGTVSDEGHLPGYMGIAFFLWMKRAIDDAYTGG